MFQIVEQPRLLQVVIMQQRIHGIGMQLTLQNLIDLWSSSILVIDAKIIFILFNNIL